MFVLLDRSGDLDLFEPDVCMCAATRDPAES